MIFSTLPETEYGFLPRLKSMFESPDKSQTGKCSSKKKKNSEKVLKNTKFLEIKEQRPEDVHKTLERLDKIF